MKFLHFINKIINIGALADFDAIERKKTRVLNFMVLLGSLHSFVFIFINLVEGHYWNAGLLTLNFTGGAVFFVINYFRFTDIARVILTVLSTCVLCLSSIKFQNGNEYYLITNLVVISLIFKKSATIIWLSIITIVCFIFIRSTDTTPWMLEQLPHSRVLINMTSAVILAFLGLIFYRSEQQFYETELQQSQLSLEKKNHELSDSNTTKEKLFSIIAHDLRSPVAQLKSTLDLLKQQQLTNEQFTTITEHIALHVKQLQGGLDNLLQWSNSQLEGIEVAAQKVDFRQCLDQVLSMLQAEIENKEIKVEVSAEGGPIWVDPDHLQIVLRNLLSNAIKYSYKNGCIRITHRTLNHEAIIAVADEGDGMDKPTMDTLFSAANIISRRGTLNEKGTGIGLKLCKEFVEKNNGRIWVESNIPKGAVFYISIPATI